MIVTAAVLCLVLFLLAAGLFLLEGAFRLLPLVVAAAGLALEVMLWLASAVVAAARALRRRGASWGALRAVALR